MNIKDTPITDIKPYDNNPRKNAKAIDTVCKSIELYGFQQPIVVDSQGEIIVGHTRYQASRKLGLSTVPVLWADDLTPEQARAYRIMDNRSAENSLWDEDLLITEMADILTDNTITELSEQSGFTESEINKLFRTPDEPEVLDKPTELFRSQQGDVWILGEHRIKCGDSTSASDISDVMQNDHINLIWEDPPYGISYQTANSIHHTAEENAVRNHKIENDDLSGDKLSEFLTDHMSALMPYHRSGNAIYWCHDIRFNNMFQTILENLGYHIADTLIWKKDRHSTWLNDYQKYYEPILYGWRSGAEHVWYGAGWHPNAQSENYEDMTHEQLCDILNSMDTNYQEYKKEGTQTSKLHPTVKPWKLIQYHIYNSTKRSDIVFDGFAGSGSTLIACEKTHRKFRGIEYERKFIDVTIERWQELTGLDAIRESDGEKYSDLEPML